MGDRGRGPGPDRPVRAHVTGRRASGPAQVRRGRTSGGVSQLSIIIHQGKNRQVRRMCAQAGLTVKRLKRVREGRVTLDRALAPGAWRRLTEAELALLR